MDWVLYLCLFLLLLVGLGIVVMTLPGLWLMAASAGVYALLTHRYFIGWGTLAVLLVLALIAEIIETTAAGAGAKRAGGGRAGLWGAIIGGILGGIFLSFIPIPIVSTFVGVCLGTFLGAMVGELSTGRDVRKSAIVGVGATGGRVFGTFVKLGFGLTMLVITMVMAFPLPSRKKLAAPANPVTSVVVTTRPITQ
jgi:uncharacterized protein YqgC (DUF456 family)